MSLLMKWAEVACFSQNPVLSLCLCWFISHQRGCCAGFSLASFRGPVEGISSCMEKAAVNSSVRSELQRVNSQLTSEFDPVN